MVTQCVRGSGKQSGHGVLLFALGNECNGNFFDDKPHDQGTHKFASGDKYV
jgi:hypothetical protein